MNLETQMRELAAAARAASRTLATAPGLVRDKALTTLADLLHESRQEIFAANERDLEAARASGLDEARIDRYLSLGVSRCILGTAAVRDFDFTARMIARCA